VLQSGRKCHAPQCTAVLGALPSSFLDFCYVICYTVPMSKTLTRTICIKLDVDGHEVALQETQKCFNEAATWIASICWQEHITNTNTAHHCDYKDINHNQMLDYSC